MTIRLVPDEMAMGSLPGKGIQVIRQAISCDICGRDKQQTNHWFVAYEHGAELRIGGWNCHARTSAKARHLCGQTCLHKLVDDFMARTLACRAADSAECIPALNEPSPLSATRTDESLTSPALHRAAALAAVPILRPQRDDRPPVARSESPDHLADQVDCNSLSISPSRNPRAWRAEAWKRELERTKQDPRGLSPPRRNSVA